MSGYDAVESILDGSIGNHLAFTVGADVNAYDNLTRILEGTPIDLITVVFGNGSVLDPEKIIETLQGHSIGYASFVFTDEGGLDFEALERLIEVYGEFVTAVIVNGSVIPFDQIDSTLISGITDGPTIEFRVSLAEWEELNTNVDFPVEE